MKEHDLRHIIGQLMEGIEKNANNIGEKMDEESIHQFRVGYKKLRSIIRLASHQKNDVADIVMPAELKEIYQLAGSVRDLQLHLNNITPFFNANSNYLKSISEKINKSRKRLARSIGHVHFHSASKYLNSQFPGHIANDSLGHFVRQNNMAIDGMLQKSVINDDDVHTIRKHLKDITYTINFYNADVHAFLPLAGKMEKSALDLFIHAVSHFQDYSSGLMLLNTIEVDELSMAEVKVIESIKQLWEQKQMILKGQLLGGII